MKSEELVKSNFVYGQVYYYLSYNFFDVPKIFEYRYKSCLKENGEIVGRWFDHNPTGNHNTHNYIPVTETIGDGMFVLYDTFKEAEKCRRELVKSIYSR